MKSHALAGLLVAGLVLACAGEANAQKRFERGWVDVNFGLALAGEKTPPTVTATNTVFFERAQYDVDYRFPTGAAFDFGGGVMLSPYNGVGVSVSGTAHEDSATLSVNIPHPLFLNRHGFDESVTSGTLTRAEGAIHIQGMSVLPLRDNRLRLRFFAGPSYFRMTMDAVSDIRYTQTFFLDGRNNIAITEYETIEIEETAWGFHAGGDVSMFFSRVVGVGGFGRFSRATITVDSQDVLRDEPYELKVGGFQFGGGLRLKF